MAKKISQNQRVTQVVKIVLGDLKKPKKKKKRKKTKPKMRSVLDVVRNPRPYEIPLYYPPFPSVINNQPKQPSVQKAVESVLRNYNDVNTAELKRLRGDFTAYRQEAQTAFKQRVAYPKTTTALVEPPSIEPSITPVVAEPPSETESVIMEKAGAGAGKLTEPEMTDVSDFEGLTSGTEIKVPARKKVGFMDLTSGEESDFAPRATQKERQIRRNTKSMKEIKKELREAGIGGYSGMKQSELYRFAVKSGIEINR
jgi:hypothetical protein